MSPGHLAPLERPEAFCALLLDFMRRLPAEQFPSHA
jgi:hypothetical protein